MSLLRSSCCWLTLFALSSLGFAQQAGSPKERAAEILKATGIKGGIVVHLGSGDGELTAALRANDSYQVRGLIRMRTMSQSLDAVCEPRESTGRSRSIGSTGLCCRTSTIL